MKPIVPEQPQTRTTFGRPKARRAAHVSVCAFALAVVFSVFTPGWYVAAAMLAGAAASSVLAVAFRVFERPRQFIESRPSRFEGAKVIH